MKKAFIGICLVLAAAFLLFKDYIQIPDLDIPLWILICSAIFIIGAISNLFEKDYQGSIGSLAILFIILNFHYDWLRVGTSTLIAAFVLGMIGLHFLFDKDEND